MENIDDIEEEIKLVPPVALAKHVTYNNKIERDQSNFEMPTRTKSLSLVEQDIFLSVQDAY